MNFKRNGYYNKFTLFTVPLPDRPSVFMCARGDETDTRRAVVIVDAERFLRLWRANPNDLHADVARGTPETWPLDRKFQGAVDGFFSGMENPVPLALASFLMVNVDGEHVPSVTLTNGVTRTIWLLTNRCSAFPIECDIGSAANLHRTAAVAGTEVWTVAQLTERNDVPDDQSF